MGRAAARWSTLVLAAVLAACGGDDRPADVVADGGRDLPAEAFDVPPGDEVRDAVVADEGVPPDLPVTCADLLTAWQCLSGADCEAWQDCTGPEPCDTPPCWGDYCTDFPGACQPRLMAKACPGLTGCDPGQGCAGTVDGDLGACRLLPGAPGACWEDGDCKGGQRCTGEVRCDVRRVSACQDHPGLCLPASATGACLDDEECPAGSWCRGATLCRVGDTLCADLAGTCVPREGAGCHVDSPDCQGDPGGPFCVGATPDEPGWCSPGPAQHGGDCWEDDDCGEGEACRGAAPCPPGRRCRTGGQHAGFCTPFPAEGTTGILMTYAGNSQGDPEGLAVIRNGLPVAIVVPVCFTLNLQTAQDQVWPGPTEFTGLMNDALCPAGAPVDEVLRIPAGGTRTLRGLQNTTAAGSFKRFVLVYRMGCDGLPPTTTCRVTNRVAYSAAFQ